MAGRHHGDLGGLDVPPARLHATHLAVFASNAGDRAIFNNVHAQPIGRARIAPRHRVMARHAGAALKRGAQHGVAAVQVDGRHDLLDLCRRQPFAIDAVVAVGGDAALSIAHVLQVVGQVHHAALAEHDVVVQGLRQPFP
ncbi:hypothetical protein D3C72_1586160 [compost metagenome]